MAFQRQTDIPKGFDPGDRTKPWGTSHAILSAKDKVKGDFLVLNADDFYGSDAFMQASKFFADERFIDAEVKESPKNNKEHLIINYVE